MKTFTKRLGLLVALILCVTVGGVYATWTYASTAGVSETVNKAVSLAPATQSGSIGEYEILLQDFSLIIDQTAVGDYTPKLSIFKAEGTEGALRLVFKPNNIASDEVKASATTSTLTFSSTLQHEGIDVFSFPKTITIGKVGSGETYEWEWNETNSSFECTIPNEVLAECIILNYTKKLDTFAKYKEFETSLTTGNVVLTLANAAALAG